MYDGFESIFCANVGDCRALLCRDNTALQLSQDHKALNAEEVANIAAHGNHILSGSSGVTMLILV